ncbi:hypothetical protein ABIE27_004814 [Paenibacillus sp. 4624]|uniref:hypothetical protein n=1 Tax=Paenibacillus sp. 4624 TaxID=3156453 RepID=UPI003D1B8647
MVVPGAGRSFDRWLSSDGFGISLQWRTSDDKRERSASPESLPPLHYALLLKEGLLKRALAFHGSIGKQSGGSRGWAFRGRGVLSIAGCPRMVLESPSLGNIR